MRAGVGAGASGGYSGAAAGLLRAAGASVGDTVRVSAGGAEHEGAVMPRYEGVAGDVLVLKLRSGYNAGVRVGAGDRAELVSGAPPAPPAPEAPRAAPGAPRILLVGTGGTIASRVDYRTGAVAPAASPAEILAAVPELAGVADVEARPLLSEYSENMLPEHWLAVARELDAAAGGGYAGALVAHGTDTMQYTAAYLSFALRGYPAPVALVGSQRSSDRPSSDAAGNLLAAARFVLSGRRGVYIVMGSGGSGPAAHPGTRARKMHASSRDAFETVGGGAVPLGGGAPPAGGAPYFAPGGYRPRLALDARAGLLKCHPGLGPSVLEGMVASGHRAVILEGTGLGHAGRVLHGAIAAACGAGVFVGMASQCVRGRVNMSVYETGRDLLRAGVTPLGDMLAETALAKAMWACGLARDAAGVRELMLERAASETSD